MREDAIDHAVAHCSVAASLVMAEDAILFGTQCLNGSLRCQVEIVRAQADHVAPRRVERVSEQQQFATGVDVAALPALCVPGVTDLDAINRGDDIVIAGATDDPLVNSRTAALRTDVSVAAQRPASVARERQSKDA